MKRAGILTLVILLMLLSAIPSWAAKETLRGAAAVVPLEEAGFLMEVQPKTSDLEVYCTAQATEAKELVAVEDYYVTRAVDIDMSNSLKTTVQLTKPIRMVFSFNEIDFKRASRMNTKLSVGHFRVGYWNKASKIWEEIPSQVFWNGTRGEVEGEALQGAGRYALLWSYKGGTSLSPVNGQGIRVMIDFKTVKSEVSPYTKDGRTMVPLRVIAENMGALVEWNAKESRVDLVRKSDKIKLWVGKKEAIKNNETMAIDVAPEIVDGRTFVPLRFVAEAFGSKVDWNDLAQTAKVFCN
ncbi:MAG: stalk domain-containing protein [Bacillota bacterium]